MHHDAQLADGRVIVELAAADLPDHVPSLAEALDACAGMDVNIEIKNWPEDPDFDPTDLVAAHVVELVQRTDRRSTVLVSSFNMPTSTGCAPSTTASRPRSSTSASTARAASRKRWSTVTARSTRGIRSSAPT